MNKTRGFEVVSKYKNDGVKLPIRSTKNSAGYDFFALEDITIKGMKHLMPKAEDAVKGFFNEFKNTKSESTLEKVNKIMKPTLVPTGVKSYMKEHEFLQLANRSTNPLKNQLFLSNGIGVIDSDYYNNPSNEGHIMFQFTNFGYEDIVIKKGQAIGQGIFLPFLLADGDESTGTREGGFGSTT